MPSCGKNLTEAQRREVAAMIDSFYKESTEDRTKPAWTGDNFKKFMLLGYIKANDVHKFCSSYLASKGNESVFVNPPDEGDEETIEDSFDKLLDEYDGFALKPNKLLKKYQPTCPV